MIPRQCRTEKRTGHRAYRGPPRRDVLLLDRQARCRLHPRRHRRRVQRIACTQSCNSGTARRLRQKNRANGSIPYLHKIGLIFLVPGCYQSVNLTSQANLRTQYENLVLDTYKTLPFRRRRTGRTILTIWSFPAYSASLLAASLSYNAEQIPGLE